LRSQRSSLSNRNSGDLRIREELWRCKTCLRKAWDYLWIYSGRMYGLAEYNRARQAPQVHRATCVSHKGQSAVDYSPARIPDRSSACHLSKMGKRNKSELPNPSNVTNRDILQRLNFLYQASVYLESISHKSGDSTDTGAGPSSSSDSGPAIGEADPSSTAPLSKAARRKRDREYRKGRIIRAGDIGQGYVRAMRLIGQKATVKM